MAKSNPEELNEAKSLAELAGVGGSSFEGDMVSMEHIKDKPIIVHDFKFLPSTFRDGDYVCIQISLKGVKCVVNTNAQVLLKYFSSINKEQLPAPTTFYMRTPTEGTKEYWDAK